jgi:hypothetical protein
VCKIIKGGGGGVSERGGSAPNCQDFKDVKGGRGSRSGSLDTMVQSALRRPLRSARHTIAHRFASPVKITPIVRYLCAPTWPLDRMR